MPNPFNFIKHLLAKLQATGFTMLETLIGLGLVSATGMMVAFMSANMITSSKQTHDSYRCASVTNNVMTYFSKYGTGLSSKDVSTIKKSGGGYTR